MTDIKKPKKIHRGVWLLIGLLAAWCLTLAIGIFVFDSENNYTKVAIVIASMSVFVIAWLAALCCRRK